MEDKLFIDVNNISKIYYSENNNGSKENKFYALNDVSFHIDEGERVGIIGRNGAGKSTLLSIMSGFSKQSSGTFYTNGKINAILEVGTSIQEEMTGRENVYLGGELYGLPKEKIERLMPEIIEFVDIGEYFDRPMKTYSSGMKARIAFSIITFIEPEILIIDEALGVGDASFAQKSTKKINELCNSGKILLIVSHSMGTIRNMTERCIWLERGKVIMDGKSDDVIIEYLKFVRKLESEKLQKRRKQIGKDNNFLKINYFTLYSIDNVESNIFELYEDIYIRINVEVYKKVVHPDLVLHIENSDGFLIMENRLSEELDEDFVIEPGKNFELETMIPKCNFAEDNYEIFCTIYSDQEIINQSVQEFKIVDKLQEYYSKPLCFFDGYWDFELNGRKIKNEHIWNNSF